MPWPASGVQPHPGTQARPLRLPLKRGDYIILDATQPYRMGIGEGTWASLSTGRRQSAQEMPAAALSPSNDSSDDASSRRKARVYPEDLRYSKEHEWVKFDGDRGRVGITDYAQEELGDVVNVELPPIGRTVRQFNPFGVVESVKAVQDLYAPVSGAVVAVNGQL